MDFDYLMEDNYQEPDFAINLKGYLKFIMDNKFFYSVIIDILTDPDHIGRVLIITDELNNNGRGAWQTLLSHYDNEKIEDSVIENVCDRWMSLHLHQVHLGTCRTYITNYAGVVSQMIQEEVLVNENALRFFFDSYQS